MLWFAAKTVLALLANRLCERIRPRVWYFHTMVESTVDEVITLDCWVVERKPWQEEPNFKKIFSFT